MITNNEIYTAICNDRNVVNSPVSIQNYYECRLTV